MNANEPIGFISEETLAMLADPEWRALRNEPAQLWTANNPPSRAIVPVYAQPPALVAGAERDKGTPAATWRKDGEPDPHGTIYDCERAGLCMGDLTDDELANGAFLNYDNFDIDALVSGKPDYYPPIAWMTAVKDRIRWLSRRLVEASGAADTEPHGQDKTESLPLPPSLPTVVPCSACTSEIYCEMNGCRRAP